jgi:hypothetical protein
MKQAQFAEDEAVMIHCNFVNLRCVMFTYYHTLHLDRVHNLYFHKMHRIQLTVEP